MNLRLFSIALLISGLPLNASSGANISLNKGDFVAAERTSPEGEAIVSVKLSKSGKAKLRKHSDHFLEKNVRADITSAVSDFKLGESLKA